MKKLTALVLLVAIMLQILNRAVIYIDYYTNTAAFAFNCVNKAMPAMHCNGKCQMMKKFKEQEKKDTQLPDKRFVNDDVISSKTFFVSVIYSPNNGKAIYNSFRGGQLTDMPRSCFHPPGA
ncbi:MAG: hypothetical protein ABI813_05315 [Bacteroidota bacterium]